MKHWKSIVILLLLSIFSSACGQVEEVTESSTKTITINGITPMAKEESEIKVTPTPTEEPVGYPINMDIAIDTEACNGMNRKFTRGIDSGASLFCVDDEETVYFVNQNRDNYLYEMKDGVVQVAVALPVKEVYPFGDYVYFMISEDTEEQKAGDIYQYKKETKELELLYALGTIRGGEHHKLNVNEQGVHFNYSEIVSSVDGVIRNKVSFYTLPFGASEPVKDTTNQGKVGWENYYFSYPLETADSIEPAKIAFISRTKGEDDSIPLEIGEFQYCIAGDKLYSINLGSSVISTFHLETKKKKVYDLRSEIISANAYLKEEIEDCFGEGMEEISSFTITENGDYLWATDGEYLYCVDMTAKQFYPMDTIATTDSNRKIEQLYTDGRRVYGLYSADGTEEPRLVRFCVENIELVEVHLLDKLMIQVEYLVAEGDDTVPAIPEYEFCVKQDMQVQNEQYSLETEQYLYLCGEIKSGEGIEEHIYQNCTVEVTIDTYEEVCKTCNVIETQLGFGEKRKYCIGNFLE